MVVVVLRPVVLLVAVASPGAVVTLAIVVPVPAMVLAVMLEVVAPLVLVLVLLLLLLLLLPLRLLATRLWPTARRSNPHPALEHVGSEPVAPV